nr:ABC transporter substrate-binding protein [Ottowia sp.]
AASSAAAGLGLPAMAQSTGSRVIRIGTTFDNSGVEKANGSGLFLGSSAYFDALNKAGGINGSKVELVMKDDGFKPDVSKTNALALAEDPAVLAILHPLGTRQTAAVIDAVPGLAVVGPNTGTVALRKKPSPNAFWVRANYDQEIERLVAQAASVGQTRIGLVHPKDPLGQSLLAGFTAAMARHKIEPVVIATTPGTTSMEVDPAAKEIAKASPQIVIVGLAGTAAAFIKALRAAGGNSTIYGISISAGSIFGMGDQAHGVGFSIPVLSPFAARSELVRRYQADMLAAGHKTFSLSSMEGYVDACVLAEGMRRAGSSLNRASLIAGLERIEGWDAGGMRFNFSRGNHEGSTFVDVAIIGGGGRLLT